MGSEIRAEVSVKNKYWIDKHRYYELKHFCLQYPQWKKEYINLDTLALSSTSFINKTSDQRLPQDIVAKYAIEKVYYSDKIDLIENAAFNADSELYMYIIKGVTESLSFAYLKARLDIPCGKDMYYDRYRRFFWFLNKARK